MKIKHFYNDIKKRSTVRQYSKRTISAAKLKKIIESAEFAPSVHNAQPWRFFVTTNKKKILAIANILDSKSKKLLAGFSIILKTTSDVVRKAPVLVVVYNSCNLSNRMKRFEEPYYSVTLNSEIQSIAAAIENILLTACSFGVGGAWLTSPLFCSKDLSKFLKLNGLLVAMVTLGYPSEKTKKTKKVFVKNYVEFDL